MQLKRITLSLTLAFTLTSLGTALAQSQTDPEKAATKGSLSTKLLGAWAFAGKPDSTDDPKPGATLKIIGLKHFVIVHAKPETGEVVHCHGGTYTLDGDTYAETVAFGNETRKFLIGQTIKFKIKVEGDIFIQEGIGHNYNERWVRQKPEK
jgi:hypothetical protein